MRSGARGVAWAGVWALVGSLVLGGLSVWAFYRGSVALEAAAVQFDAPGPRTVQLRAGTNYVLTDSDETELSDVLVADASGSPLALDADTTETLTPTGGEAHTAVARFEAKVKGDYTITVRRPGAHVIVSRGILSQGNDVLGLIAIFVALFGLFVAFVLLIVALAMRLASPRRAPSYQPYPQRPPYPPGRLY